MVCKFKFVRDGHNIALYMHQFNSASHPKFDWTVEIVLEFDKK